MVGFARITVNSDNVIRIGGLAYVKVLDMKKKKKIN